MTIAQTPPPRDRALGRGVSNFIPQAASPADQAAAALAALHTVPVQVGVLQAAVVLLENLTPEDDAARETVATTVTLLRTAMARRD
ncbi:hypothetical protein [Streptomyces mobaraensis]|uniref:Uncharacterized protein n=1 Tax=Streptomyces mobaraensis TaxID=35621 RepID=A0A5N5VZG2_STRMB|nr:hypothetical protein [Streptomyces mobaraensis]KAB7833561.1 hypothetical protein FRZ00_33495 [Streptomyces mobaraensis]